MMFAIIVTYKPSCIFKDDDGTDICDNDSEMFPGYDKRD